MKRKALILLFGLVVALVMTAPVLIAVAAPDRFELSSNVLFPNASLVAVLLAVPALYLLRGPFDPR